MRNDPPLDPRQLPLPLAAEIDRLCDRFGAEWAAGRRPKAEDYLTDVAEGLRAPLLAELLRVELEARRRAGEAITVREFHERFPDDTSAVEAAFHPTQQAVPGPCGPDGLLSIGKYRVVELLGGGGQARTYLAFDPDLKRRVVLKLYHGADTPEQQEQVLKEGRALARVQGPYLARCFGAERDGDRVYLILEYVPGRTLAAILQERASGFGEAVRLMVHVAEGLESVHACGMLHRDLKPSNTLIGDDGMPRLIDFGLAAPLASDELHGVSGTLSYMAPEQARGQGERLDARTDVFGLGAVLYALLTGRPPYKDPDPRRLLELARRGQVTPPRQVEPSIPGPLDRICVKALAADPSRRFGSAAEFGRALGRYRRRPLRMAGTAVAACVLILLGLIPLLRRTAPRAGPDGAISPVTTPDLTALAPVRIVRFDIEHLAGRGGEEFDVGKLGERSFAVRSGDDVTVDADLSEPAHSYLIAFRPDGVDEVFQPEDPETPPGKTARPRYPPESEPGRAYRLSEGAGLHAFALVVSRAPLPSYRQWKGRHGTPPWQERLSAAAGVVWSYDGRRLRPLTGEDLGDQRGAGATIRGGGGPVAELAAWLKRIPGVDDVAIKAFPVPPASVP
jgi:hypothetical protein